MGDLSVGTQARVPVSIPQRPEKQERGRFPLEKCASLVRRNVPSKARQGEAKHESVFIAQIRNRITDRWPGRMRRRERSKFRDKFRGRYGCSDGKKEQLRREKNDAGIPLRAGTQKLP